MKKHIYSFQKTASKLLAVSLLLFICSQTTFAQNNTLSTDTLILPSTGVLGGSGTATIRVRNLENAQYTGPIRFYCMIDSGTTPFILDSLSNVSLLPQGTASITTTISYNSPVFHSGDNIVVVWSSGNGRFAADSIRDTINLTPSGIHENNLNASFTIFPSPAKDFITIKFNKSALSKDLLQSIKITDVFGRTMHTEPFTGGGEGQKINVRNLPSGSYFLELQYGNRKRAIQKFIRMD
jgi:hypothetical protein